MNSLSIGYGVTSVDPAGFSWRGFSRYMGLSLFGAPGEDGLIVSIGGENADMRLAGVSVVAKEYVAPTGVGLVACIGPTRMDYMRVIGAVKSGASRLEDIFGVLG